MDAKIEFVNTRMFVRNTVEVEQQIKLRTVVKEGSFINFHNVEPFSKINEKDECFVVKKIMQDAIAFEVVNCNGVILTIEDKKYEAKEGVQYLLPINKKLLIDDSFDGVECFITLELTGNK